MKIVDAQIHLWSSGLPMPPHRQITSWGIDEALAAMDEAGIDAAIIHPPLSWDPSANALAEQAATLHPRRFGILGQVPIDRPAESRPLLASWRSRPGQCGLRWPLLRPDQQTWHIDGTMDWVWEEAERHGLPVATMAGRFLKDFGEIARRHPRLRLIVDHLGLPRDARDTLFLLFVIVWVIAPQVGTLPVWATLMVASLMLWRGWLAWSGQPLPSRWTLLLLLGVAVAGTLFTHRTILGRDAGVTFLVVLLALKTLELRARRDAFVIFFLGFFTLLSNFFFSQGLLTAASMLVGLLGLLTALVLSHMTVGRPSMRMVPSFMRGPLSARCGVVRTGAGPCRAGPAAARG